MTTVDFYLNDVWTKVIDSLFINKLVPENVTPFFKSKLVSLNENEAVVVTNTFINYSLMNQSIVLIENQLEEVLGHHVKLVIKQENEVKKDDEEFTNTMYFNSLNIDENQTFSNFVVGRSNAQAQIASLTCASNLGIVYNPLFIYGNSGLGKTHLLNAIANQIKQLYPDKKICYTTGLSFVEGVHKAEIEKKYDNFKESFNEIDVLLIDDIQFIAGKPKTHELFFTVFNNLISNKKQICLTSDKTPSEIKGLEDRIISRFNQGLTVNIEAPEYETSINILKMKIKNAIGLNQSVDDEVLHYLATNFSHDVRSLEGAINRLLFYSINFSNEEKITLKLANEAFKGQIQESKNELNISTIEKAVCDYYNLTKTQLESNGRTKTIANARHIAMYLCRKLLDASFKDIGREFGGRDHSTVINACEKVEKLIKSDALYLKVINEIENRLK